MKSSRILMTGAAVALGTMLAWGAAPAVTAPSTSAFTARQGQMQQMSPEDRAKAYVDRLDKAVTLTDDQKTKITAIVTQAYKDQADARANQDMDKAREIGTKMTADVKAVLTPDQVAKMPAGRGRRGGGGGGGLL